MWTRAEQLGALAFAREELTAIQKEMHAVLGEHPTGRACDMAWRLLEDAISEEQHVNEAIVALGMGSWPIWFRPGVKRLMQALMAMHGVAGLVVALHRENTGLAMR